MLYHKVGPNVEFATNFPGFYNMNISDKAPYISLMRSGGKKRKISRKLRKSRNKKRSRSSRKLSRKL